MDDYWDSFGHQSITVHTEGFSQQPGFVPRKETTMNRNNPTPEELANLRAAADLQNVMPTLDTEISGMMNSTMQAVFGKIRKGELTDEEALSYWMEMYAYSRLNTRLKDRASLANAITETKEMTHGA